MSPINFISFLKYSFTFILYYYTYIYKEETVCIYKHLCNQFNDIFLNTKHIFQCDFN